MIKHLLLLLLFAGIGTPSIFAQDIDLQKDTAFFFSQDSTYQQWLTDIGLGEYLSKDKLQIRKTKLIYSLKFEYVAEDTAVYAWKRLKKDFEKDKAFSLEEQLFFKLTDLMEIDYDQLILKVSNTPKYGELPAVDGRIRYNEETGEVEWSGDFRSTVPDSVIIKDYVLCDQYNENSELLTAPELPEEWKAKIYNALIDSLTTRFKAKTDDVKIKNKDPIEIKVMNIKEEVIPGGMVGLLNPNELLTYRIAMKKEAEGIRLSCVVDGRFGFSLWRLRTSKNFRDMSPEYHEELVDYTNAFTKVTLTELVEKILQQQ